MRPLLDFPYFVRDPSSAPVGRLAPSPTGAQHLGNARTFLIAWLSARQHGGKLLLRIEDLDTPRTKPGAASQAVDDLRWLGLDWDHAPGQEGHLPPLIQSQRVDRYREILQICIEHDWVYPCTCTRSDVEQAQSAPHESNMMANPSLATGELVYPGTCSRRSVDEAHALIRQKIPFAWRFRLPDEQVSWCDGFYGPQTLHPAQTLGDFVVGRANGAPAYQLAVVVDDHDMHVTEVVRGDDLIPSTYRQLAIYRALNWTPPQMIHVPLVVGLDGRRLAKRHGDTRLATLREQGIEPEIVIGYLALTCGWMDSFRPMTARDLVDRAALSKIPDKPLVFPSDQAVDFFRSMRA